MKTLMTFCLLLFVLLQSVFSQKTEKTVEITYISNEGYLIQVNEKKILTDALFTDNPWTDTVSIETRNNIFTSKKPFNNVSLISASHSHFDHFDDVAIAKFLALNPQCKFISTRNSIDIIKEKALDMNINNQLFDITPDTLSYVDTTINGINLRVYRMDHSPYYVMDKQTGKRKNLIPNYKQNLAILFNIDGVKIIHFGDSYTVNLKDYEKFQFQNEKIDLAFLGSWFMQEKNNSGIQIIKTHIQPKNIILMHLPKGQVDQARKFVNDNKDEFPNVYVLKNELETITLKIKD